MAESGHTTNVQYRQFEREFLRLAFTTRVELNPASLAFLTAIPVADAERHMQTMVSLGLLELGSTDDGRLIYSMPDRPEEPMHIDNPALIGHRDVRTRVLVQRPDGSPASQALVVRSMTPLTWTTPPVTRGQACASLFLNAMVCPGVGSLVGGRTGAGVAQLSMFLVGLPLAMIAVGLPLIVAAWVWSVGTGAQLIAESDR